MTIINPETEKQSLQAVIDRRKDNFGMEIMGVGRLRFPASQDAMLIREVQEVASRIGFDTVNVLLHDGSQGMNAYLLDDDTIVLSEDVMKLLNPKEYKALLTHELDHKFRKDQVAAINQHFRTAVENPETAQAALKTSKNETEKIELLADRRAAEYYGATTMRDALIKLLVDPTNELMASIVRQTVFPDLEPEALSNISHQQFVDRLHAVARGEVELPTTMTDTVVRLRALHEQAITQQPVLNVEMGGAAHHGELVRRSIDGPDYPQ